MAGLLGSLSGTNYYNEIPKGEILEDLIAVLRITSISRPETLPRGAPSRFLRTYNVYLYVANVDVDESAATQRHDDILQLVEHTLRTTPLMVTIHDTTASPNETSVVVRVGEKFDVIEDGTSQMLAEEGDESNILARSIVMAEVQEKVVSV